MLQPEQEPRHVVTYDEEAHVYSCSCGASSDSIVKHLRIGETVTVTGTVRTLELLWPDGRARVTLDVARGDA